MLRVPPWWVVARPARRSRSVRLMVTMSWHGQSGLIRQLTCREQAPAGFLERVVQPLRRGAVIRTQRVVGPLGGQRGEDGVPDRQTGRREIALEQAGAVSQPGQGQPAVGLLPALLLRARSVRIEVGEDPLTQQLDGARVTGPGVLQQRRLDLPGVLGLLRSGNRFDNLGDLGRMLRPDLTGRERLRGGRQPRLQRLAGQAPPGTEPLHRQIPLPRLARAAAQLRRDQLRQAAIAERAGNIARVQFGQHRQLPELHPGKLGLQTPQPRRAAPHP